MAEIVDLTALGPDLNQLVRAGNNAKAVPGGVEAFKMTKVQRELMGVLIQSSVNRRSKVLRDKFLDVPIIEVEG